MQKDKNLHKLFRARLPVAILPQEFADRLTKAVLNEVAQLHQSTLLASNRVDHPRADQNQPEVPAITKAHIPFKSTTAALLLFLLLNLQLWPLLQGCAFNPTNKLSVNLTISLQSVQQHAQKLESTVPEATVHALLLTRAAAPHIPPLEVVKPQLPMLGLPPAPRVLVPTRVSTQTPPNAVDESFVNQHGPPGAEQPPTRLTAITLPYEQPSATQAIPPESTVEATTVPMPTATDSESSEPPVITTAIATVEVTVAATVVEPTLPATLAALSPTPTMAVFEPTMTPTPATQVPGATVTDELMPTSTSLIRPWHTSTPASTAGPTSEATLAPSTPAS